MGMTPQYQDHHCTWCIQKLVMVNLHCSRNCWSHRHSLLVVALTVKFLNLCVEYMLLPVLLLYCSDEVISNNNLNLKDKYLVMEIIEWHPHLNVQHEPQDPWFFTGLTMPVSLQSFYKNKLVFSSLNNISRYANENTHLPFQEGHQMSIHDFLSS